MALDQDQQLHHHCAVGSTDSTRKCYAKEGLSSAAMVTEDYFDHQFILKIFRLCIMY